MSDRLGRISGERCRYPTPTTVSATPSVQPIASRFGSSRSCDYQLLQVWPKASNDFAVLCGHLTRRLKVVVRSRRSTPA